MIVDSGKTKLEELLTLVCKCGSLSESTYNYHRRIEPRICDCQCEFCIIWRIAGKERTH